MKPWERDWQEPASQPKPWERTYGEPAPQAPQKPAQPAAPQADEYDPASGMSTLERVRASIGSGAERGFALLKNAAMDGAVAIENAFPALSKLDKAIGAPTAVELKQRGDAERAELSRRNAPLENTTAGKIGSIIGTAGVALPTALIPGANTYTGAALIGAGTGAAMSETGERGAGAAFGAAGGAAGTAIGRGLGAGVSAARDRLAKLAALKAAQVSQQQAAVVSAQSAGYVVPPTMANPTKTNRLLEGFAGKLTTAQQASLKNQEVTNRLIRDSLGIADDVPLTAETLNGLRSQAGRAYDDLANFGTFRKDAAYDVDLMKIRKPMDELAKDFPELANKEVYQVLDAVNKQSFDSGAAIEALKRFRFDGNANKISLDPAKKELGRVQLKAADAMESLIERNLQKFVGGDEMLANFRNARQTIAKTYTVEKALNSQTGNVDALKLAAALKKGKPMTGGIRTAAEFGEAFRPAAREPVSSPTGTSPLDWVAAGGISAASANPMLLALAGARPAVRSAILSSPYQRLMTVPATPRVNALMELANRGLNNDMVRRTMPALGGLYLPEALGQ